MALGNIWIKSKLLSRAFLEDGKLLFMSTKHTFWDVLMFEIFWYHLKEMLVNSQKAEL